MADGDALLTLAEAAKELRISVRSAQRGIRNGTFPVPIFRPTPGKALVSRRMLDRYLATGQSVTVSA